jgi:hypothetical protein
MKLYRQGDVLVMAVDAIPKNTTPAQLDEGRVILAYGEVTGHCHEVLGDCEFLVTDLDEMADRFLRVEQECQVVHDEHSTILLPPGNYVVRRQVEYMPEAIRNVAD